MRILQYFHDDFEALYHTNWIKALQIVSDHGTHIALHLAKDLLQSFCSFIHCQMFFFILFLFQFLIIISIGFNNIFGFIFILNFRIDLSFKVS